MKNLAKIISKKQCPFLKDNFHIDVSTNKLASDFLKNFSSLCPHLNSNTVEKDAHLFSHPPIAPDNVQKAQEKCPFVGLLQVEEGTNKQFVPQDYINHIERLNTAARVNNAYNSQFSSAIEGLKQEGRYRVFNHIKRIAGKFPKAIYTDAVTNQTKEITVWCSNDYLGMGQNQFVKDALINAVEETGVGAGGTRNIGGSSVYHTQLENEIADLHGKEKAIVLSSGFVANQGAINALTKVLKDVIYLSDAKNHASIIEGIRNSRADKIIWKHNDLVDLEEKLKQLPLSRNKIIIFESVYSMSGTISPIKEIAQLAKKYNALTFIDEVHAIGLYGKRGGGVSEQLGVMDQIDIFSGTLGKAYGCVGGYISGNSVLIDVVRSFAQNFIFTTSIPPCIANAAATSIRYVKEHNELREKIHSVTSSIKSKLAEKNIPVLPGRSHIIPVFIGDAKKAKLASDLLMSKYNIYVQPINYPTVEKGKELLRVSPTPNHTDEMINQLIEGMDGVFEELNLTRVTRAEVEEQIQTNENIGQQLVAFS